MQFSTPYFFTIEFRGKKYNHSMDTWIALATMGAEMTITTIFYVDFACQIFVRFKFHTQQKKWKSRFLVKLEISHLLCINTIGPHSQPSKHAEVWLEDFTYSIHLEIIHCQLLSWGLGMAWHVSLQRPANQTVNMHQHLSCNYIRYFCLIRNPIVGRQIASSR